MLWPHYLQNYEILILILYNAMHTYLLTHSLTAALDQLRIVASSTSNDLGLQSGQHQQTGQCLLPFVAAKFFVDDPADASSQRQEECQCGLLLTVAATVNRNPYTCICIRSFQIFTLGYQS